MAFAAYQARLLTVQDNTWHMCLQIFQPLRLYLQLAGNHADSPAAMQVRDRCC